VYGYLEGYERTATVVGRWEGSVEGMNMFNDIYKGKRVLVTGHTGVKGSWMSLWLSRLGAYVYGISHPPKPGPNHYKLLKLHDILVQDIHADISAIEDIKNISPDIVFHFAAKAIVPRTFMEPESTFQHNIMGVVHILELCRQCPSVKGVVAVVSDKVYENREWNYAYRENDVLGGADPYSCSKVCIEHIIRCYRESYGMNIAAARAGNILAGGDWGEKRLLPDIVRATAKGETVVVHTPDATRPFQHALEALQGYLLLGQHILERKDVNRAWNFGPDGEMTVLEVLQTAQQVWPEVDWWVDDTPTHPHMVYLLKIDSTESRKLLGWRPVWDMKTAVEVSIRWYKEYYESGIILTDDNIESYETWRGYQ
jgi:CDP-glucose 4,6-dehydratase